MAIRALKITLVGFVALQAFIYATQNIVNLDVAYQAVARVTSNADHKIYPSSMGPSLDHPVLVWMALGLILLGDTPSPCWRARAHGTCGAPGSRRPISMAPRVTPFWAAA